MNDMYREVIIDHYKNPSHKGVLEPNDITFKDENPLCGDKVRIDLRIKDEIVVEAAFSGYGCAISQAAADMLIETIVGKTVEEAKKLTKQDILDLLGIELGPVRLKCALLPLKVLKAGVYGVQQATDSLLDD